MLILQAFYRGSAVTVEPLPGFDRVDGRVQLTSGTWRARAKNAPPVNVGAPRATTRPVKFAARALTDAGMDDVAGHEAALTAYALERLRSLPGITIYGASNHRPSGDRVGVIAFNLGSAHHALIAAVLGYEGGIGVRSGCFCAQPYVARLLNLSAAERDGWRRELSAEDKPRKPGMVRVSFGAYNTFRDVDALIETLWLIVRKEYRGEYCWVPESGECLPTNYRDSVADYFSLANRDSPEPTVYAPAAPTRPDQFPAFQRIAAPTA